MLPPQEATLQRCSLLFVVGSSAISSTDTPPHLQDRAQLQREYQDYSTISLAVRERHQTKARPHNAQNRVCWRPWPYDAEGVRAQHSLALKTDDLEAWEPGNTCMAFALSAFFSLLVL